MKYKYTYTRGTLVHEVQVHVYTRYTCTWSTSTRIHAVHVKVHVKVRVPLVSVAKFYLFCVYKTFLDIAIWLGSGVKPGKAGYYCLKNVTFEVQTLPKTKLFSSFFQAQLFNTASFFNNNRFLSRKGSSRRNSRASKMHGFWILRHRIVPFGATAIFSSWCCL